MLFKRWKYSKQNIMDWKSVFNNDKNYPKLIEESDVATIFPGGQNMTMVNSHSISFMQKQFSAFGVRLVLKRWLISMEFGCTAICWSLFNSWVGLISGIIIFYFLTTISTSKLLLFLILTVSKSDLVCDVKFSSIIQKTLEMLLLL